MFYSMGMSHLGFPLANNKVEGDDDDNYGDSTPFSFLASNHAALHHTRRHHHEQRGKSMEMGKTERGEEFQPVFGEERRGSTKTCPSFPSLLYSSLLFSSSPLSFLDLVTAKGGAGRGDGLGFTNGMYSMRYTQPQCLFVHSSNGSKNLILAINFMYSHVESVFWPSLMLSVTFSPP